MIELLGSSTIKLTEETGMIALILFEILNALDGIFTYKLVILGGAEELNPLVYYLINMWGVYGLILIKGISALLGLFLYIYRVKILELVTIPYVFLTIYHINLIWG